jgi:RimJ/RimL family protein N-acetyltransferase
MDHVVAEMVKARVSHLDAYPSAYHVFGECRALGVLRDDKLIGGVVFHGYRPIDKDIMVSVAFDRADWARPSTLRTLFEFPFVTLGCERITAICAKSNKRVRRFVRGTGWTEEGSHPKLILGTETGISYGMTKEACRFLRK